jgi:hypothetical protein
VKAVTDIRAVRADECTSVDVGAGKRIDIRLVFCARVQIEGSSCSLGWTGTD